jgi:hypothetical protein
MHGEWTKNVFAKIENGCKKVMAIEDLVLFMRWKRCDIEQFDQIFRLSISISLWEYIQKIEYEQGEDERIILHMYNRLKLIGMLHLMKQTVYCISIGIIIRDSILKEPVIAEAYMDGIYYYISIAVVEVTFYHMSKCGRLNYKILMLKADYIYIYIYIYIILPNTLERGMMHA